MPTIANTLTVPFASTTLAALALVTTLTLAGSDSVYAQSTIRFLGVHAGKANLTIDRKRVLLAPGEFSPSGIELVSVDSQTAVVRIDGDSYRLDRRSTTPQRLDEQVVIERRNGMFFTPGQINGKSADFIVDTGASHVVLSAADARRLRIRYSTHEPIRVNTASGWELAYRVQLDSVAVGDIVLSQVPALVVRGKAPIKPLLGMSFLTQIEFSQSGSRMVMRR